MASEQYYDFVMRFNAQTEGIRGAIGRVSSSVNTLSGTLVGLKAVEWAGAMIGAAKDVAMEIADIGLEAVKMADGLDAATRHLTASTGGGLEAMKNNMEVIGEIYSNNFGESFDEVAQSVGAVKQAFRSLSDEELVDVTQQAMMMQDAFGMDVKGTTDAINGMTKTFGISVNEAFNLIAQGSQQGANKADDLLSIINEYSVHYKMAGLSAYDMMNTLAKGAQDGAFQVDFLGDAVKEFGIRAKDGSKTSAEAYAALGMNAEEATNAFAKGGQGAYDVFKRVTTGIKNMQNEVIREQIGVGLFGTKFEDLGADAIIALSEIESLVDGSKDVMQQIEQNMYGNPFARLQGMARNFYQDIYEDIVNQDFPGLQKIIDQLEIEMPEVKTQVREAINEVRAFFEANEDEISALIKQIPELTALIIDSSKNIAKTLKFLNDWVFTANGIRNMIHGEPVQETTTAPKSGNAPNFSGGNFGGFAYGTSFAPGGLAMAGEHGPELVGMPRGSRVHTAGDTRSMLQSLGGSSGGNDFTVNLSLPANATQDQVNQASGMTKKAFAGMLDDVLKNKNRVSFS